MSGATGRFAALGRGVRREILTPDGVPLVFEVATAGDRLTAFLIDILANILLLILVALAAVVASGFSPGGWIGAFITLTFFVIWNFYFVWFEVRWQGATPGKRAIGLRVIDAHGGMLRGEAVFARNLTRNVEVYIPALVLLNPEALLPGLPGPMILASSLWLFVLALLPLFNRDRRRIGDLIGGTLVVRNPRTVLLADVSRAGRRRSAEDSGIRFTPSQLELYGVYELQVLEDLLRRRPVDKKAARVVCRKVKLKIGWAGETADPVAFLNTFYTAQRAHLEQKLLFGERRERKRRGRLQE